MSVYVELTLASIVDREATEYAGSVSIAERPGAARVATLVAAFVGVSSVVFLLAKLHLARPSLPAADLGGKVALGDFYRGQTIFSQSCASCHGTDGVGGPVGPRLVGLPLSLVAAKAQIDNGGTTMPAGLVSGRKEADVLAFLATVLAKSH
jgi:mono/diheme cytochrome c family protein